MFNSSNPENQVTVSIVSHGHCNMLSSLLTQISHLESSIAHVIITHNIQSDLMVDASSFSFQTTIMGDNHMCD